MLTKRENTIPEAGSIHIDLGNGFFAIIDAEDYEWVSRYKWHVRHASGCHYAVRKVISGGREFLVSMHRMLMHTPRALVVHHINHNGLDNRKKNLLNITRDQHTEIHRFT